MTALPSIPTPPGPRDGKRLSPWRVLVGILAVLAVAAGGVLGYRLLVVDQARASTVAPWFAGYVDTTLTPQYGFEAPEVEADDHVVLSFVVAASADQCAPSWGGAYSLDAAASDLDLDRRIARLRQVGGDAVVSFGGAAGVELATACTDVEQLTAAYRSVVERYDLSTIDLDVEADDLADTVAGERRAQALAELQDERRSDGHPLAAWLTLPVMPTGLTDEGTHVVDQMLAAGVDLAGVDVMTMDYGVDLGGRSMGAAAIDALNAVHDQLRAAYATIDATPTDATLWARLGATPMIGQNDVAGEVFTLDDAAELNRFAQEKQLGRLSAWSLNRDRSCGPNHPDLGTVSNLCSGVDQGQQTFAATLAAGLTGTPGALPEVPDVAPTAAASATASATPSPGSSAAPGRGHEAEAPADDPATSPYPIWSDTTTYLAGSKVVWHGTVYQAKWWTLGDAPDAPVDEATATPWLLLGPVLPGETPHPTPTVPPGTFPEWSGTDVYQEGDHVLFRGVPYVAKWWTQGDSPAAAQKDSAASPWYPLDAAQVAQIVGGGGTPTATPDAG